MTETKPRFAWCFSHGRLHTFWTDETPWCTATWVWLDGTTEDEAMQIKASAYGEAVFLHDLPSAEAQLAVMDKSKEDQA